MSLVSVLAACGGKNEGDLTQYVQKVKARAAIAIVPLPKPVIYEAYGYQSDSQRDPFKPAFRRDKIASKSKGGEGGPDLSRERGHLEEFPLEGLQLQGMLPLLPGLQVRHRNRWMSSRNPHRPPLRFWTLL